MKQQSAAMYVSIAGSLSCFSLFKAYAKECGNKLAKVETYLARSVSGFFKFPVIESNFCYFELQSLETVVHLHLLPFT